MSDEEKAALRRELQEILKASPQLRSSRIEVTVADGVVTLTGDVTTFYYKQIAQESLRANLRGLELMNFLEVTR